MQDQPTGKVETQEHAVQVLLDWQVSAGAARTQPAWDDTQETDAGWAFFNVNGYLGTVTPEGEVITEDQFADDDTDDD
jgi:hypothetical protein